MIKSYVYQIKLKATLPEEVTDKSYFKEYMKKKKERLAAEAAEAEAAAKEQK